MFIPYSKENITARIKEANNSTNSKEMIHLSQDLKIKEVERRERVKNAKGDISIKTLIKIYLIAYIKTTLRKPIDITVLIIPSMEKTLAVFDSICIIELETSINLEKQIGVSKILEQVSRIAKETRLLKLIICSHKKKLEFIQIPN